MSTDLDVVRRLRYEFDSRTERRSRRCSRLRVGESVSETRVHLRDPLQERSCYRIGTVYDFVRSSLNDESRTKPFTLCAYTPAYPSTC
jgi:hypothetical protein